MKRFFIILFILSNIRLLATTDETQATIRGVVKDQATGETLVGANLLIKNTLTGSTTDNNGKFKISTTTPFPFTLVVSYIGYKTIELEIENDTELTIQLTEGSTLTQEVVVTASRVEEKVMQSPVAIEKMDYLAIKESASPGFFDALEAVKGVQMTTLSLGFKVPNTRGFTNTTNARFLQLIDGADSQAPGLGVSIANTVGATELDILSIEIIPGASSSLYGMNALNGMSNFITKNPFYHQGLSFYQKSGVNHIGSFDYSPRYFNESAIRYAKAWNNKFAFKFNAGFLQGTDWVANSSRELSPDNNASVGLFGLDNPGSDPLNSYGNESSNRKTITLGDGKRYEVRRTGYYEKDLVNDNYNVDNFKADLGLYYRFNEKSELSYVYRIGKSDAIYQRGNRIRLDDYYVQQHKLEFKNEHWTLRTYFTQEFTKHSYNLRPMGENMDRSFKSDSQWYSDYTTSFNGYYSGGTAVADAHHLARLAADNGRYVPGTAEFDAKRDELAHINNWDQGAQLYMKNGFYQGEGQYSFGNLIKFADVIAGGDYRNYIIRPEGNSFINPDPEDPYKILNYYKFGGFVQATKKLFENKLKVIASARIDKNQYFDPKFNPRVAVVFSPRENHNIRASYQNGYRFPTLFEGFSSVNNGGVIRYGGLKIMSEHLQLFENSYLRKSVDDFQKAVTRDVNNGMSQSQAEQNNAGLLKRNEYTYLVPEQIQAFDLGYKTTLIKNKLYLDVDGYYNIYHNFIDQVEIAVPKYGAIGDPGTSGTDTTISQMANNSKQVRYRMWTNAKSVYYNYGASVGINYSLPKGYNLSGNFSVAFLDKVDTKDSGLETPFNTPPYIVNVSFSNREVIKNLGFTISWRWQDAFDWNSPLANGRIGAYHTVDAQITLKIPKAYSSVKIGASNLLNHYYNQYEGGPQIGGFYYIAWTIDGLLK